MSGIHAQFRRHRRRRHSRGDGVPHASGAPAGARSTGPVAAPAPPAARNHPLDTAVECLLACLLAFAPFAFGAVEAWSEAVVIGLAGLIALCFCLKLLVAPRVAVVRTWAYLPVALFLLLAAFQLLPLPAGPAGVISPATVRLRAEVLGNLPGAPALLGRATLSLYPAATRHDLRLVLAASAVFVVVLNTYRRPAQILRLLVIVAVVGAAAVALALAQDLSGATHIYWIGPPGRGAANAGPFLTYSHYGQFMNLSVGAGLGLLLVVLHKSIRSGRARHRASSSRSFAGARRRAGLAPACLLGGFVALGAVTIFLSGSRGAAVGLLVALGLGTLALSRAGGLPGRAWAVLAGALVACAAVLLLGPTAFFDRLATLEKATSYADRLQIVKDLTVAWRQFPALGTGLGTHEVVYPMFEHSTRPETFTHAEDDYAQALEETGVVGLGLVLLFVGTVAANYRRAVGAATRSADGRAEGGGGAPARLAAVGLGVGLVAVLVHSFSDFGQHLPANACLSAVFCGLLVSLGRVNGSHARTAPPEEAKRYDAAAPWPAMPARPARSARLGRMAATALVCAAFAWAGSAALGAARAEVHWHRASAVEQSLASADWDGTNSTYIDLLSEASAAAADAPDNVRYRYSLDLYRWHAISRVRDPGTEDVVIGPRGLGAARRIVADLAETRLLCPTYGRTYCLAGQLETMLLNDPRGPADVRAACRLAGADQWAWELAARLDARDGDWSRARQEFRRFLALGGWFGEVMRDCLEEADRPDQAVEAAGDDPALLLAAAAAVERKHPESPLVAKARADAYRLRRAAADAAGAPAELLAEAAEDRLREHDAAGAAAYYQRALAQDYGRVEWHLARARALKEAGRLDEAAREAEVCPRLGPQSAAAAAALQFLQELSQPPAAPPATPPAMPPATRPDGSGQAPANNLERPRA